MNTKPKCPNDDANCKPVKTLVRNVRSTPAVPVRDKSRKDLNAPKNRNVRSSSASRVPSQTVPRDINLAEPQLHTTLKIQENLQKMKAGVKSVRFERQPPPEPSKAPSSRNVNIRFDEQIYKNLIDLKVSEEDLGLRPICSVKPKDMSKTRDPEPELADYFRPIFDKEYVVKPPKPHFSIVPQVPIRRKHPSAVYEAYKRWTIDDFPNN